MKECFRKYYKKYKETYKFYASWYPVGEIWCVSSFAFSEFISAINVVDNKLIKISDVDIKLVATLSAPEFKGNPRNPERGLVRYQLLEAIARIAEEKFVRNKVKFLHYYIIIIKINILNRFVGMLKLWK